MRVVYPQNGTAVVKGSNTVGPPFVLYNIVRDVYLQQALRLLVWIAHQVLLKSRDYSSGRTSSFSQKRVLDKVKSSSREYPRYR